MRIYLDNCVFQDLKKEENQYLLSIIKSDKTRNIYCFSEAHLYDLTRDPSIQKYDDMQFMAEIAENHCFYFKEKTRFEYLTPAEYYDSFDWSATTTMSDLFPEHDQLSQTIKLLFQTIPLNFADLIPSDQLPADMPDGFKDLL